MPIACKPTLLLRCALLLWVLSPVTGCVTWAEFHKLEKEVIDHQRATQGVSGERVQLADTMAEIDGLRDELRMIEGRMEVLEQAAGEALQEARKARREAAMLGEPGAGGAGSHDAGAGDAGAGGAGAVVGGERGGEPMSRELAAYREAYGAWRADELDNCIDQFRKFLHTYPASPHADDAVFWMGDCYFKQGDFRNAILRFDDVVSNYPTSEKAPDALYRQGESLLRLGPGYHQAAKTAFERVLREYPDSARAQEAQQQLAAIGAG